MPQARQVNLSLTTLLLTFACFACDLISQPKLNHRGRFGLFIHIFVVAADAAAAPSGV
jgi:hypothetical protein